MKVEIDKQKYMDKFEDKFKLPIGRRTIFDRDLLQNGAWL